MRYRKEYLIARKWHKIVIHDHNKKELQSSLKKLSHDYMCQSGGPWIVIMIEDYDDLVYFRLSYGFNDKDYRGYKIWA